MADAPDFFSGRGLQFTDDVFKSVESYIEDGAQQLERKLVQSKGTVVTNAEAQAIHNGTSEYMQLVSRSFTKNFDKFELYILRNVFVAPANIAEIQQKYQHEIDASFTDAAHWSEADVSALELELHQLRQQIQTATLKQEQLHAAQVALDAQVANVDELCRSLQFTEGMSETVAPFTHQMVSSATGLRDVIGTMRGSQLRR
ncbi:hypothetical protein SPRG_03545 [Saprolegnia parasitica CBS 223.65]|uniref:Uncharacterized protein n=1 Tax=Saprolegnia parasitica (strain CBS 223.65) TaxID=695850 RepID=A0A067CQW3_SAPPC|nr:hypothetical protein SPRG_03545 [Saprolegnia parasitica CBS 223.65]KDO31625.1 hypothetical protein SPRG_03545 [Saprolegnia parasitica CBS 223.65]|eukprot:XP_012197515.1 hypothetical protein SPRG_03545 [Saprolegnia parasitica CBS 223.65]